MSKCIVKGSDYWALFYWLMLYINYNIFMVTNKKIDKRTLEVEASQWKRAKLKTISATIFHVLQDSPVQARKVWKALRKLHKVVKSSSLTNWEWIYADYLFGWDNINLWQLDNQVKVHKKIFLCCMNEIHLLEMKQ